MEVVDGLIRRAAFRSEASLSAARMLFCLGFGLRFFGTDLFESDSSGGVHRLLMLLVIGVPIVFSAVVLHKFVRDALDARWLAASVLLDAVISTVGLGTNVVYPGSLYRGILAIPDTAGLLVVMMAAGLRLSARLALLGIGANSLGLALLVVGDFTICSKPDLDYSLGTVLLWPVFIAGAASFALLSAWRTRSLATYGASESVRLERARQNLKALLHGHHDAHAVLSSAALNTDLLLRDPSSGPDARRVADSLRQDLVLLRECVRSLKQRADGELINTLDSSDVALDDDVRRFAERLSAQLGAIRLVMNTRAPGTRARVAGGRLGLSRILLNLLLNARDASGPRRTSQIWVETSVDDAGAHLTVKDDGPGFEQAPGARATTKLEGTGVGLSVVAAIAEASGGSVHLAGNEPHGARVDVRLPIQGAAAG
jgi:signal transduction histidine kinase